MYNQRNLHKDSLYQCDISVTKPMLKGKKKLRLVLTLLPSSYCNGTFRKDSEVQKAKCVGRIVGANKFRNA